MVFRWSTRILVIDTDASRRIHFTSLFRYSEAAETEFFRETGPALKKRWAAKKAATV
jgi:acyl-CoA thioesterase FadM